MRQVGIVICLALLSACAAKIVPAPLISTPTFPEFIRPAVPPGLTSSRAAISQDRGWRFLQTGDLQNAEKEFAAALKAVPAFYPAESGLGYLALARKDARTALPHFDRTLVQHSDDVSALVGRGQALVALGRDADSILAFEEALRVDPTLTDVARRVEVLRFRSVESNLASARQAARAGRVDEAIEVYEAAIATSPDSAFLYRELAAIEREAGRDDAALEHFRGAVAIESDAASLAQIGEILEARGDLDGAASAYADSLNVEPNADVQARLDSLRARAETVRLPEEYRAIETAAQVTRADLAALIGIRLQPLLQTGRRRDAVVVTDVRNTWASTWIMDVARAAVMEPYANHTFQPRAVVRRVDLAPVVSRLLLRVAEVNPSQPRTWQSARVRFSDLSTGHLAYPAASVSVASGVMTTGAGNSFQPSRPVTGSEALDIITRIERLAGLSNSKGQNVR